MSRRLSGLGIALLVILAGPSPLPAGAATLERAPSADPTRQIELLLGRLVRYRDGLEHSARRLSLAEALRQGMAANPTLRQSWEAVRQADWSVVAIQREWWPSLIAGSDDPGILGWTTTTTREKIRGPQGNSRSVTVSGGQSSLPNLTLSWSFLDPSRGSRGNAARSELVARRFLFDVDARDLILRIQSAYVLLQEQADLERDYRGLYDDLTALLAGGMPPGGDRGRIDQLRTEQLALLTLRIQAHENVIVAANALAQALALPPGQLVMPSEPLALLGRWDLPLQATIEQALRLREEIQASVASAGGDAWSARARQRGYLPTLSLAGQLSGTTANTAGGSLIGSFQATSTLSRQIESQLGIGFDWTIFDGGILSAEAAALRSRSRQALEQADLDRLSVTRQVQNNHAALLSSLIVVDVTGEQLAVARSSLAAASRDFRSGRSDATRVVQALNACRDATTSYRGALRKHNTAIAGLQRHSAVWPEGTWSLLTAAFPEQALPLRPMPAP
jgi:outer membrane protein TolC